MHLNINGKNYELTEVPVTNNNTVCNTAPKNISNQKTLTINIKKTSDNAFAIPTSHPVDPYDPTACQHHPEVCTPKTNFWGLTINFYDDDLGVTAHGGADSSDVHDNLQPSEDSTSATPPENIGGHGNSGTGGAGGAGSSGPSHPAERISHDRKNIIINILK